MGSHQQPSLSNDDFPQLGLAALWTANPGQPQTTQRQRQQQAAGDSSSTANGGINAAAVKQPKQKKGQKVALQDLGFSYGGSATSSAAAASVPAAPVQHGLQGEALYLTVLAASIRPAGQAQGTVPCTTTAGQGADTMLQAVSAARQRQGMGYATHHVSRIVSGFMEVNVRVGCLYLDG